jgi:hypothetical protein
MLYRLKKGLFFYQYYSLACSFEAVIVTSGLQFLADVNNINDIGGCIQVGNCTIRFFGGGTVHV